METGFIQELIHSNFNTNKKKSQKIFKSSLKLNFLLLTTTKTKIYSTKQKIHQKLIALHNFSKKNNSISLSALKKHGKTKSRYLWHWMGCNQ